MAKMNINVSQVGHVVLSLFDMKGELVTTLFDGVQSVGNHQVVWTRILC